MTGNCNSFVLCSQTQPFPVHAERLDFCVLILAGVSVHHWFLPSRRQWFYFVMCTPANWSIQSVCGWFWRLCQQKPSFLQPTTARSREPRRCRADCRAGAFSLQLNRPIAQISYCFNLCFLSWALTGCFYIHLSVLSSTVGGRFFGERADNVGRL